MDAKVFLKRVKMLDTKIKNKLIEIQQWRDIAMNITTNGFGERVSSSGGSSSKMADAIDKCVDMEREVDSLIDELIDIKREVIKTIEELDSATEYNVLHLRYIQFLSLQDIADKYHKEYGWATTCHGRALKNVQRILDKREEK